ncbi:7 transmembrane receptor [Dictyocaulus viviparus]|uniref:7 transmembrane receptor n=1 Tax=Dictyocaulus viviparus TaxID=29172 RepID=A0A0D8XE22_DICVI|nr:7 transmembrane receptor [Dictyocaulus viviparus]
MAATVFNVMVIFCAVKLFKRSGDTMHLFILNMTVGDLILTVFCHPNELLIRKHDFLQQVHLCAVVHYFNWTGLAVSGLSLTMLNIDKLIYFRWPLNYDRSMSKRRAALFCLLIWGLSVGFISYCWLFNIVYIHSFDCSLQMSPGKKFYYEIFLILFCVLPVTSSLIVSIYLFNLTRQKRSAGSGGDTSAFKNKVKSLVFIFATTAWTSCSLLPYRIMNLARIHLFTWSELSCEGKQLMNWIAWILIYLLTINPVFIDSIVCLCNILHILNNGAQICFQIVNPLITSLIYAPYRMTIKKFLVNIPVGNRPLYNYQGEHLHLDSSSFASIRRNRNRRSSSTESASLRQSTEVRMSVGEPWTPSKSSLKDRSEQEFSFEKKMEVINEDSQSR